MFSRLRDNQKLGIIKSGVSKVYCMPINVKWANEEKTIIHFEVIGDFDADEYINGIQQRKALQGTVNHKSSVVADFSKCGNLPPNVLVNLRKAAQTMPHPNFTGILVIANARGIVFQFARVFSRTFGKLHFADSLEEAFELIEKLTGGKTSESASER